MSDGVSLNVSLSSLEATNNTVEKDIKSFIRTLIRTGKQERKWCNEYASEGNLSKAWKHHKQAERNLAEVNWWMARQERECQS